MPLNTLKGVALPSEFAHVGRLAADARSAVNWDRLLFSAKESVYKAWFPSGQRLLEFTDAEVRLSPDGTFTAQLRIGGSGADGATGIECIKDFTGRWLSRNGLLLTAVYAPADGAPHGRSSGVARPAKGVFA
jgi:4'-phosphopantetheinyl transferase EntD